MQASADFYRLESIRISAVEKLLEAVLGTELEAVPIAGRQGQGSIDLAISENSKQVKALLTPLLSAAHIQLAQLHSIQCQWPVWSYVAASTC